MMLSVCTNLAALTAQNNLKGISKKTEKNMEKLSSGFRVSCAADDAAGLEISEKMRALIRGLDQGSKNTMDGISFIQTGDGAMSEATDIIHRITELTIQGMNDTLNVEDREAIDEEIVQLKDELKRIGLTTEFNDKLVFDNSNVAMKIDGETHIDISVYNSNFVNGKAEFGGIIINGDRIPWDTISKDMVKMENGQQIFQGGTYPYTYAGPPSITLTLDCKDGAQVPDITQHKDIRVVGRNLIIDGEIFPLPESFEDEDGNPATSLEPEEGYMLRYQNAEILFYIPKGVSSVEEFGRKFNESYGTNGRYSWDITYCGQELEKAVDANVQPVIRVSKAMAEELVTGDDKYSLELKVDEEGIALTRNGNEIAGSRMLWEEFKDTNGRGITSWLNPSPTMDGGSGIVNGFETQKFTYEYYIDGENNCHKDHGADLAFSFRLSDITSLKSIQDGIDGMKLNCNTIKTSYTAENINGVTSLGIRITSTITLEDEWKMEQLFDDKATDEKVPDRIDFNKNSSPANTLDWTSSPNGPVLTMTGTHENSGHQVEFKSQELSEHVNNLSANINGHLNTWVQQKQQALLNGETDVSNIPPLKDLADPIGANNVTNNVYFSETIDIPADITDYISGVPVIFEDKEYPGVKLKHPGVKIDFQNITDDTMLAALNGHGFDTTCRTCDDHYSTLFTNEPVYNEKGEDVGFFIDDSSQNFHELKINLNKFKEKIAENMTKDSTISYPEAVAKSLLDIMKDTGDGKSFASHFTGYGYGGSTFYIFDHRPNCNFEKYGDVHNASFYRKPFSSITPNDIKDIEIVAKSDNESTLDITLKYDVNESSKNLDVKMNVKPDDNIGDYYQLTDATGKVSYTKTPPDQAASSELAKYESGKYWLAADGTTALTTPPTPGTEANYKTFWQLNSGSLTDIDPATLPLDQQTGYMKDASGNFITAYPEQYHKYSIDFTVTSKDETGTDSSVTITESPDGQPMDAAARDIIANASARHALDSMLKDIEFDLDRIDYTHMTDVTGDERLNYASRAIFENKFTQNGDLNGLHIQHSNITYDSTVIPRYSFNPVEMGLWRIGVKTPERADRTLRAVDSALKYITDRRSSYGAYQNRLEHTFNNVTNTAENTTAAESRIRDADMAKEMMLFTQNNIVQQAVLSVLTQANQNASNVLSLL